MSTEASAEPQMNATPLVDVLLVLLVMIIFTLPVATHAVKLNLPYAKRDHAVFDPPPDIRLYIDFDGAILWNGEAVGSIAQLETRLRDLSKWVPQPRVAVYADAQAAYDPVAQVLAATQRAHVSKLSISHLARE
jgi:biopolymer transport protein ExbD